MEPEESAPEFSPAVEELRRKYNDQVEYVEEPEPAHETSSDCSSGACTRSYYSERRQIARGVSDYLMAMAIGALLPEVIFYLRYIKLF